MRRSVAEMIVRDPEKYAHHDRVFLNNPVVMQGMGLAPLVVLATTGKNALMLAVSVALLLTPSRMLACLLSRAFPLRDEQPAKEELEKKLLPRGLIYSGSAAVVYLAVYPILNALFGVDLLALGIYLPMLVVEPLLIYRFGRVQETMQKAVSKGLRITLGYVLLLLLLGCVREWMALGTVFGLPLFILALHLVCFYAESRETKKNRNPVLRTVLLWFCPAVSLLGGAVTLGTGLGYEMHISTVVPVFVGLLFLILGNYLPKIRQNRTMGIKLPWTLQSEENWTRTHRLSGFLWVLCGLVMIPLSLLRLWSGWLFGVLLAVMVLIPAVYSYALHRKGI